MSALHYLIFGEWPTVQQLQVNLIVYLIILALLSPLIFHIIKKEMKSNGKSKDNNG
jgi:hypothetical protein